MMTSSNGNIFRVTGHLCGEFTDPRWIPRTKASDAGFDVFFDLRLNKQLRKQSRGWWYETLSRPLWRHCNEETAANVIVYTCNDSEMGQYQVREITWHEVTTQINGTHMIISSEFMINKTFSESWYSGSKITKRFGNLFSGSFEFISLFGIRFWIPKCMNKIQFSRN